MTKNIFTFKMRLFELFSKHSDYFCWRQKIERLLCLLLCFTYITLLSEVVSGHTLVNNETNQVEKTYNVKDTSWIWVPIPDWEADNSTLDSWYDLCSQVCAGFRLHQIHAEWNLCKEEKKRKKCKKSILFPAVVVLLE